MTSSNVKTTGFTEALSFDVGKSNIILSEDIEGKAGLEATCKDSVPEKEATDETTTGAEEGKGSDGIRREAMDSADQLDARAAPVSQGGQKTKKELNPKRRQCPCPKRNQNASSKPAKSQQPKVRDTCWSGKHPQENDQAQPAHTSPGRTKDIRDTQKIPELKIMRMR